METLYRIEELCTTGWELVNEDCVGLTKDQTTAALNDLIEGGINPNSLRAVPQRVV